MVRLYVATCLITNKMYVGITLRTVKIRVREHLRVASKSPKFKFHHAINKYGSHNFEFVELFSYPTLAEAQEAEMALVAALDLHVAGYNSSLGGETSPSIVPEIAAKISAARKGVHFSLEHRANIAAAKIGSKASDETRRLQSESRRGRKLSDHHKSRISEGKMGGTVSSSHRAAISATLSGRKLLPFSDEHRRRMSESAKRREARNLNILGLHL